MKNNCSYECNLSGLHSWGGDGCFCLVWPGGWGAVTSRSSCWSRVGVAALADVVGAFVGVAVPASRFSWPGRVGVADLAKCMVVHSLVGGCLCSAWSGGRGAAGSHFCGLAQPFLFLTTELNRTGGRSLLIRSDTTPHREGHATHYKQQAKHTGFFLPRSNSQLHFRRTGTRFFP